MSLRDDAGRRVTADALRACAVWLALVVVPVVALMLCGRCYGR